jgi:hypothetical protein
VNKTCACVAAAELRSSNMDCRSENVSLNNLPMFLVLTFGDFSQFPPDSQDQLAEVLIGETALLELQVRNI